MNNVVALRRRNSAPIGFAKNDGRSMDLNLILGVTVFGLLPQAVAISYYGFLLAEILGVCLLVGISLGFVLRRVFPYRVQTLAINSLIHSRLVRDTVTRKAA